MAREAILPLAELSRRPRLETWPILLRRSISQHQRAPFAWGISDCASMFADAVLAMTGWDPMGDARGYDSERSAVRALGRAGYYSMREAVAARFLEVHPVHAGRGDLGFPAIQDGAADVGIGGVDEDVHLLASPFVIDGAHAFSKTQRGFAVLPRSALTRTFAV